MNPVEKSLFRLFIGLGVALGCCFAQLGYKDTFQLNYLSNLSLGGANVNITNGGVFLDICVNAYVFNPNGSMASCCSCLITHNFANHLERLVPTEGFTPNSVTVKLVTTAPFGVNTCGDPTRAPTSNEPTTTPRAGPFSGGFATGMRAWATRLHTGAPVFGDGTEFSKVFLSSQELDVLTNTCKFNVPVASRCSCAAGYL